jgi:3-hydroxyisobutyrate dehydrogenase-like beta-hydroxyacid dehydrogenase
VRPERAARVRDQTSGTGFRRSLAGLGEMGKGIAGKGIKAGGPVRWCENACGARLLVRRDVVFAG